MACAKCGGDWVTKTGKECASCPHCDKQQRCIARKQGRWVEPTLKKKCLVCGAEFLCVGNDEINRRKYCGSAACETERKKAKSKQARKRRKAGMHVKQKTVATPRFCRRCNKRLTRRDQKTYCNRTCAGADVREYKRPACGKAVVDRVASDFADWAEAWDKLRPKPERPYVSPYGVCQHCHVDQVAPGSRRFCSKECHKAWRGTRKCRCGVEVHNCTAYGPCVCKPCKRKARGAWNRITGSYRKRCRLYGGHFNPRVNRIKVMERDGWRCHVCKRKCRKDFDPHDPRSATVDHHPVPLSKGGDHDWHNVRCCCFRCNSLKGATWDGQVRMQLVT